MENYQDLKRFFQNKKMRLIMVADAEPRVHVKKNGKFLDVIPAGGVSIVLEPVAKASSAIYVARAKNQEEKQVLDRSNKIQIQNGDGSYTLKRLFLNDKEISDYYYGFSNQTLWPLCHVAFEAPEFRDDWYLGYQKINARFANNIKDEIRGNTFVWIHDYQLCLVPKFLGKQKNTIVAMFWHIPWPTWEAFRILPHKHEILESLLSCNFLAFHRGYHVRNFLDTVRREFEVRVDEETNTIYYKNNKTVVKNLPLGIDTTMIRSLVKGEVKTPFLANVLSNILPSEKKEEKQVTAEQKHTALLSLFKKYNVILGVDRLDYTKGLILRMQALEKFFDNNPKYLGKVTYLGILAPSREPIPAYQRLKKQIKEYGAQLNQKFAKKGWQPIHLVFDTFARSDLLTFYQKARVCLVTPRDDGMNLVSKEFVVASSMSDNPGMLVLSRFAGSAIDLTESIIVNPYDTKEVAGAIKKALEMDKNEKRRRMQNMASTLDERNSYDWSQNFIESAIAASRS